MEPEEIELLLEEIDLPVIGAVKLSKRDQYTADPRGARAADLVDKEYRKQHYDKLLELCQYQCTICEEHLLKRNAQLDHAFIPFNAGKGIGASLIVEHESGILLNNADPLCKKCNQAKGTGNVVDLLAPFPDRLERFMAVQKAMNRRVNGLDFGVVFLPEAKSQEKPRYPGGYVQILTGRESQVIQSDEHLHELLQDNGLQIYKWEICDGKVLAFGKESP